MSRPNVERHYGAYIVRGQLVQSDWDFPATAQSLGWSLSRVQRRNKIGDRDARKDATWQGTETIILDKAPPRASFASKPWQQGGSWVHGQNPRPPRNCRHSGTDGTVDCPDCGVKAGDFVRAAGEYLDSVAGL